MKKSRIILIVLHLSFLLQLIITDYWQYGIGTRIFTWLIINLPVYYAVYFFVLPKFVNKPSLWHLFRGLLVFYVIHLAQGFLGSYLLWLIHGESSSFTVNFWKDVIRRSLIFLYWGPPFIALRYFHDWQKNTLFNKSLLLRKTENQLLELKNKIDFPFINSVLEHIDQKAHVSPESISGNVLALSDLLRHSIYGSSNSLSSLQKESNAVENRLKLYKEFSQMRINFDNRSEKDYQITSGLLMRAVVHLIDRLNVDHLVSIYDEKDEVFLQISGFKTHAYDEWWAKLQESYPISLVFDFDGNTASLKLNG